MQFRHSSYQTSAAYNQCDKANLCATANVAKAGLNKILRRMNAVIAPWSCIKGPSAATVRRLPTLRATHRQTVCNIQTMWFPC